MSAVRLMRGDGASAEAPSYLDKAIAIDSQRRRRAQVFDGTPIVLEEPAWDILLQLFINHERAAEMTVQLASEAGLVPPSHSLRWIDILEAQGLVHRSGDEQLPLEQNIGLTLTAMSKILHFLDNV